MWQHVRNWFASHGDATVVFLPDEDTEGIYAYQGYLRLWLTEAAVARNRSERGDKVLAFHGGVTLNFADTEGTPFTRFIRLARDRTTPDANLDFPVTPLVPFQGGRVEVQAAMYHTPGNGLLAGAAEIADALTGISGAPLPWVAATSARLTSSLDGLLERADAPALAAHWSGDDPGGGRTLRPGWLVMVNAPSDQVGRLRIVGGRLRANDAAGPGPLPLSADYMVLRLECRPERDDWHFPQLDSLIQAAVAALLNGQMDSYRANRAAAVIYAWNSADLIPADRLRVARVVADEIDAAERAADLTASLDPSRLFAQDDPGLAQVDLLRLLGGEHSQPGT